MSDLELRKSARLVIIDPQGRLLLFRYQDEHQPAFWSTPGGELVGSENYRGAAKRELLEETGFNSAVGPLVYEREDVYAVARSVPARWCEQYFLVSCSHQQAPSRKDWSEEEHCTIGDWKWWSLKQMISADERFLPMWLPELLDAVLVLYQQRSSIVADNFLELPGKT